MSSSIVENKANLFRDLADFFANGPTQDEILAFKPSEATVKRASELLELNRQNALDHTTEKELDQFDHADTLMRLIKATIHANRADA